MRFCGPDLLHMSGNVIDQCNRCSAPETDKRMRTIRQRHDCVRMALLGQRNVPKRRRVLVDSINDAHTIPENARDKQRSSCLIDGDAGNDKCIAFSCHRNGSLVEKQSIVEKSPMHHFELAAAGEQESSVW